MSLLFEYGEWIRTTNKVELKSFLKNIWRLRLGEPFDEDKEEGVDSHYQPFLQFDEDLIRANNYVGFVQNGKELIEIYPKVFRHLPQPDKSLMMRHLFYWLGYCSKWKFPFTESALEPNDIDRLPELIIHLIGRQFLEVVSERPLMQYQMLEEALQSPKGRINFTRYVSQRLGTGNFHQLECDYEPSMFDNKINRIIKYCNRLLLSQTRLPENQTLLQEVLFILDEVEDTPCTLNDILAITLNSFYEEYILVMDLCKTIVEQKIYSHKEYDLSQWCLLFPMEYVFEDFFAGFLKTHFSDDWEVEYQKSNAYLATNPDVFQMQHDIFLTSKDPHKRKIIMDTKYKLRDYAEPKKHGVAQSDLYQVVSYAYRRGCAEVILVYPNTSEEPNEPTVFNIPSGFRNDETIKVVALEIPFWSMNEFGGLERSLKSLLAQLLK